MNGFLIVNKPSGIPVHPSMQHYEIHFQMGLNFILTLLDYTKKIRPVNRLDIGTSALSYLQNVHIHTNIFHFKCKNNTFSKTYLAIVHGKLDENTGTIDFTHS